MLPFLTSLQIFPFLTRELLLLRAEMHFDQEIQVRVQRPIFMARFPIVE